MFAYVDPGKEKKGSKAVIIVPVTTGIGVSKNSVPSVPFRFFLPGFLIKRIAEPCLLPLLPTPYSYRPSTVGVLVHCVHVRLRLQLTTGFDVLTRLQTGAKPQQRPDERYTNCTISRSKSSLGSEQVVAANGSGAVAFISANN